MIYMRGLKTRDLQAILEYTYHGEMIILFDRSIMIPNGEVTAEPLTSTQDSRLDEPDNPKVEKIELEKLA